MTIDIRKPDIKFQILNIEDQLTCPVCTNTYYNPITLLCQHTFCYHCITDDKIKDCPVCRVKKFVPATNNKGLTDNILTKISELYYGSDGIDKIRVEVEGYLEDKEIRPKIEKDIEKQLLSTLNTLAIKKSKEKKEFGFITATAVQMETPITIYHSQTYYNKYIYIIKWLMLFILSAATGWLLGEGFANVMCYFKGFGSITTPLYSIIRAIGIANILYQYIYNIMLNSYITPTISISSI